MGMAGHRIPDAAGFKLGEAHDELAAPDATRADANRVELAHRVIENTPERVAFELHYARDFQGKILRETKRITLIMSQRLFQCDSRFTLDGKPAAKLDVAIGLKPQVVGSAPVFSPKSGLMPI